MESAQVFLLLASIPLGILVLLLVFGMLMVRLSDGWKPVSDSEYSPLKVPTAARHQLPGRKADETQPLRRLGNG